MTQQVQLMKQYEVWVRKNASLARNIEHMLYITPQIAPARFGDPAIATEMAYSVVGLIKLYHDYVFSQTDSKSRKEFDRPSIVLRLPLTILAHTQVVFEALARRRGEKIKRNLILWIECVKCMLKLVLLRGQSNAMLVKGGQLSSSEESDILSKKSRTMPTVTFESALCDAGSNDYIQLAGEILHVARPVVYAATRCATDSKSWIPFGSSLAMELVGLVCTIVSAKRGASTKPCPSAAEEVSRRKICLLFYALRSPVFDLYTKPAADRACAATESIPLIGKLMELLMTQGLCYYQQYHFYTSASS